jgi:hypothetical protein
LHQDGSRHLWLPALGRQIDLIVTLDDATSEIYSAFLVDEEGTASSLRGLHEVIARHGLFCALYTDRGSHYFFTPKGSGKISRRQPTQVGRALAQLKIEHIAAYSPEARGRSERMFATLQDRLVKELADAAITTIEAANRFIAEIYLPAHNRRFTVEAGEPERLRAMERAASPGGPMPSGEAHRRERQYGALQQAAPADRAELAATALRQGDGRSPPLHRRNDRNLLWPALHRKVRR